MNDSVLEVDADVTVDADDWATLEPKPVIVDTSAELQRQVDEYLANGGKVHTFEPGETAIPVNNPLWSFPVGKASNLSTPELREQGQSRRMKAQSAASRKGVAKIRLAKHSDEELVALIAQQLGVAKTKKEMRDALGCSDTLLQRLLFSYYHDEERADPYRAMSRSDKEAMQVKRIRELMAEGQTGLSNITKLMGMANRQIIVNLDRKYGLKIPRKEPGTNGYINCANTVCHAKVTRTAKYCPQCGTITALGASEAKQ